MLLALVAAGVIEAGGFEALRARVSTRGSAADSDVDAFVTAAGGTPVIEGDEAIFLVRGAPGEALRLVGDFNGWGEEGPDAGRLEPLAGSSFFFAKLKLRADARVEYLIERGGREERDPLNPSSVDGFAEPHSELRMPAYRAPREHAPDAEGPKGRVVSFDHASPSLGNSRRVHVYLPTGHEQAPGRRYPEAWFGDGTLYVERVFVPRILDRLIAAGRIEPLVAVLVDPAERRIEYAAHEGYRRMMVEELVPRVAREFPVEARAQRRLVAGGSRGGLAAIDLALAHPEVFALCGAWAPAVAPRPVPDLLGRRRAPGSRFFLIEALYDHAWGPDAPALRDGLTALGAEARLVQIPEGHTLATWRGVIDDVLEAFFPGPAR
jgi:enterochelin esterase-like enzyme